MTKLLSTADHDLQVAVQDELAWTPELVGTSVVGVTVDDGIVTLHGQVDANAVRLAAKRAASRVRGVRAIVDDIEVATSVWDYSETDIAKAVQNALHWASDVPGGIHSVLHHGTVTLTGEVQWNHQRRAAQRAIERVIGVESVDNRITLARRPSAADARERIQHAIVRNAILDARSIDVQTDGTTVILRGTVRTWLEKRQAALTAWASPHVTEVDNRLVVKSD